jgi:hypothetical protein
MCPICKQENGQNCPVEERPDGRVICSCGKHSWPNTASFQETCRLRSLTIVRTVHAWTQSL